MEKRYFAPLRVLVGGVLVVALCMTPVPASACQLQYTGEAAKMFGSAPRGSFSSREACESYRRSSPAFERARSHCVNCSSVSSRGGYGSSEDFAMQMFGSLFSSLFQAALAPPQVDHAYQQQLLRQQEEARKKQEALKKKQAMKEYQDLLRKEEARMAREKAEKKKRGQELLAGMNRIGGGKLEPFTWGTPKLDTAPIGAGIYDTSGLTSWQRLLCSAYFSTKALDASRGGDPEGAVFMNAQSDKVTAGAMTEVECQLPGLQQLADIQRQNFQQNNRMAAMVKLLPVVQEKVKNLQQIEMKLHEAKEEKKEAKIKLEEAESKVEEAEVQAESAQTPEKKTEADDLLAQALALKDEASGEVEKAEDEERKFAEAREKQRAELKGIQEKMNVTAEK